VSRCGALPLLHSFPTRRSSDLFCGVRYNDGGELVTLNYGKSVPMTQETIETEAVYHYAPGARILSMGNIGCMMKCDFCHNWQTRSEEHTSELQSRENLVCRLLL